MTEDEILRRVTAQVLRPEAENTRLRALGRNLGHQCQTILDYWPEFQFDMSLPITKQLWRRTTEKYLRELDGQ